MMWRSTHQVGDEQEGSGMNELESHRKAADEAWDAGENALAAQHLRKVLEIAPQRFLDWVRLGTILREMQEYEASLDAIGHAIELAPRDDNEVLCDAHRALGITLMDMGKNEEAAGALRESLTVFPGHPLEHVTLLFLGVVLRRAGRKEDAEQSFRKALSVQPDDRECIFNLAMLLEDSDLQQSIGLLRRAIEIDPHYAIALRELGRIVAREGNAKEAETLLRRSIALRGDDPLTHEYLAHVLDAEGG
jgi:tetratricopeptide (TPR) repeat protein